VIIDDWRTGHTPGVAAATWEAILHEGLVPIWFTDQKLYGRGHPPRAYRGPTSNAGCMRLSW
jgi:hypothetical protein